MSINCDVILQWSATPEQLTTLGTALWRWCLRASGNIGIYQFLDNQALADLIAGKLPGSRQTEPRGIHLWVRDEASHDRQATIDSLRRALPGDGWARVFRRLGSSHKQGCAKSRSRLCPKRSESRHFDCFWPFHEVK